MKRKLTLLTGLVPWIFLALFYGLVVRFHLKYGASPLQKPLDPKSIGMLMHIVLINIFLIGFMISVPMLLYLAFSFLKDHRTTDLRYLILGFSGTAICFYVLGYSEIAEWFFD